MNLYFIRHAEAEKTAPGLKDSDRRLTQNGINEIKTASGNWKNLITDIDILISSPFKRALETAKFVAEALNYSGDIIQEKKLTGGKTEDLIELVNSLEVENIMIIGHQPHLAEYISDLISLSTAFVEFKKSSIAKVSFHNKVKLKKGTLEFLIPPSAYGV